MRYGAGALVKSLAGHDKDQIFIIIEESEEYVSLVDGKLRPLAKPKCKNKKHIQVIHDHDEPQRRELIQETKLTDEAARRIIRDYTFRQMQMRGCYDARESQAEESSRQVSIGKG